MVIKTGLSNFQSSISRGFSSGFSGGGATQQQQLGKVFGVVLDENTPSREQFERVGGYSGLGSILYLDYESSKTLFVENVDLNSCNIALPLDPNVKNYPLLHEVVTLVDGPSFDSQFTPSSGKKFYGSRVNIFNNPQQNAPVSTTLGETFAEKNDIRDLKSYEGDYIVQNKKSGIRFGSTVPLRENEWSSIGESGDPITIVVNGYVTTNTGSLAPNIEEINKEMSSIYMTSTQALPLTPGAFIINPIVSSLRPSSYINSQLIFNSDRITLNSKKDEVLIFSKANIELSTDNIINLNAGDYIHLHIDQNNDRSRIFLGTNKDGSSPAEPVVLGGQMYDLLINLLDALGKLAVSLTRAKAITSTGSIPVPSLVEAGDNLFDDIDEITDRLEGILSEKVFTV